MKAKEPTNRPRSALAQPNRDAMQQDRDKGLPSNRSLTPRAEDGCSAAPESFVPLETAVAGALNEHLTARKNGGA